MAALLTAFPTAVQAQMEFSLDEVDEEDAKPVKDSKSQGDLIEELAAGSDADSGPTEPAPQACTPRPGGCRATASNDSRSALIRAGSISWRASPSRT